MTIEFENESTLDLGINLTEIAETVINGALDYLKCPYEVSVSLLITGLDEIHQINKEQRDVDRPTDVLSFPMINFSEPGTFDFLEDYGCDGFDPDSGELLLGDIVICAEKVLEQSKEYNHSVTREYAFLIAHSMLHLTGYDHMEEEEAKEMERLQDEILNSLGITRSM